MKFVLALVVSAHTALAQIPTPPVDPPEIPPPETSPPEPSRPAPSTILTPPVPTTTGDPISGPICECGYTYCASVLMDMNVPWSEGQLADAYCGTDGAPCGDDDSPATDVTAALYICLCQDEKTTLGNNLELVCGCDECLILPPDYRGRCKTPCLSEGLDEWD